MDLWFVQMKREQTKMFIQDMPYINIQSEIFLNIIDSCHATGLLKLKKYRVFNVRNILDCCSQCLEIWTTTKIFFRYLQPIKVFPVVRILVSYLFRFLSGNIRKIPISWYFQAFSPELCGSPEIVESAVQREIKSMKLEFRINMPKIERWVNCLIHHDKLAKKFKEKKRFICVRVESLV